MFHVASLVPEVLLHMFISGTLTDIRCVLRANARTSSLRTTSSSYLSRVALSSNPQSFSLPIIASTSWSKRLRGRSCFAPVPLRHPLLSARDAPLAVLSRRRGRSWLVNTQALCLPLQQQCRRSSRSTRQGYVKQCQQACQKHFIIPRRPLL